MNTDAHISPESSSLQFATPLEGEPEILLPWDGEGQAQAGSSRVHWLLRGAEMGYFLLLSFSVFIFQLCSKLIMFLSPSVLMMPTLPVKNE